MMRLDTDFVVQLTHEARFPVWRIRSTCEIGPEEKCLEKGIFEH